MKRELHKRRSSPRSCWLGGGRVGHRLCGTGVGTRQNTGQGTESEGQGQGNARLAEVEEGRGRPNDSQLYWLGLLSFSQED
jgi:hypothetical protein